MELVDIVAQTNYDHVRSKRELVMDRHWLKDTFLLREDVDGAYSSWLKANKYVSSADYKFGSTAIGMALSVNPPPQPCRYTDIRRAGKLRARDPYDMRKTGVPGYGLDTPGHPYGLGFGRWYSEAIDDNQQRIFIRCGEPQYMGMLTWLGKSFDINKAILYKRGFITSTILRLIDLGTKILSVAFAPLLFAGKILLEFVLQPSKFISVRDNMYTYWTVAETLLNQMFVRRTKVPYMYEDFSKGLSGKIGQTQEVTRNFIEGMNSLIPGVVDPETGRISVWTIALRSQAAYNKMLYADLERLDKEDVTSAYEDYKFSDEKHDTYFASSNNHSVGFTRWFMRKAFETINESGGSYEGAAADLASIGAKLAGVSGDMREVEGEEDIPYMPSMNEIVLDPNGAVIQPKPGTTNYQLSSDGMMEANEKNKEKQAVFERYGEYMQAALMGGAGFAVFTVSNTGSIGESFSNSSVVNPIETLFNSLSSTVRQATNTMGGMGEIPVVGDMMKFAMDAAAITVSNLSMGLANPLLALLYGTQISLPKSWESSSASFPSANYKLRLSSPYGNSYSQLFNMYLPLAMIMAFSLPRSTGLDTFTAPFLVQLFDKGRVNIPYGMVESLNITRGVSNFSFSRGGQPNAIDVDLNIIDLNQVLALDISGNGIISRFMEQLSPRFGDTTSQNYVNTITGMDPYSMVYKENMGRLKLAERQMTIKSLFTDQAAQAGLVSNLPIINQIPGWFGNPANLQQDLSNR